MEKVFKKVLNDGGRLGVQDRVRKQVMEMS